MTELRFAKDLYSGEAIDAAVKAYAEVCSATLSATDDYWCVVITEPVGVSEALIASELGNYALGLTIEDRGVTTP
ncbi:MAG: HxsD-like protein [Polyangiaceae bacterium]|nr:HxsD-like protein [Polyangiaceae bacterium]